MTTEIEETRRAIEIHEKLDAMLAALTEDMPDHRFVLIALHANEPAHDERILRIALTTSMPDRRATMGLLEAVLACEKQQEARAKRGRHE